MGLLQHADTPATEPPGYNLCGSVAGVSVSRMTCPGDGRPGRRGRDGDDIEPRCIKPPRGVPTRRPDASRRRDLAARRGWGVWLLMGCSVPNLGGGRSFYMVSARGKLSIPNHSPKSLFHSRVLINLFLVKKKGRPDFKNPIYRLKLQGLASLAHWCGPTLNRNWLPQSFAS